MGYCPWDRKESDRTEAPYLPCTPSYLLVQLLPFSLPLSFPLSLPLAFPPLFTSFFASFFHRTISKHLVVPDSVLEEALWSLLIPGSLQLRGKTLTLKHKLNVFGE